ncbi:AAA family ATPase [Candidatus Woesearchaeota archaeon]|nr:MAG: DNA repair protein RadB [archaeon GW2011_AR4]MBS3130370.1 AAA family ATPase [Candidatus Woesearchaeota archaeon]HIH38235.1 AAA family ATPase [Candidatus Woesearchaeota archaeon]HIH49822.1 AAA family ATPase [Candidatus Woesearchaeota archaeon]HIJ04179.1 AAA family ATPase [Candidatus Woesearchaeota archaeon]
MTMILGSPLLTRFLGREDQLIILYGPAATGKTTLCFEAAISKVKEKKKVLFIDTEQGFSVERIKQMAPFWTEEMFQHIIYLDPVNFYKQNQYINRLPAILDSSRISLVIVDSLSYFYRAEWKKDPDLMNTILKKQLRTFHELSRLHRIPFIITNQVYGALRNPYKDFEMIGARVVKEQADAIIELKKVGEKNYASLIHPETKKCEIKIEKNGIFVP